MKPEIEISSLSINKLKNSHDDFVKYDIEVSLDEVENSDLGIKLKYKFALLSNPTNTKINVDGFVSIQGNEQETSNLLESDQKNIPAIVNIVYQEIYPLFYIISKSVNIPCPSYKLSEISQASQPEIKKDEIPVSQPSVTNSDTASVELSPDAENKQLEPPLESSDQEIVQEVNVSSN